MIEDKLNKQSNQLWFYQERKDFEESSIAWKPTFDTEKWE